VLGLFTAVAPDVLGQILGVHSPAIVGLVVLTVFAASIAAQTALMGVSAPAALSAGCIGLIAGMVLIGLALASSSLVLLVLGGVVAGAGQGLSFRAGLAAVNDASPADRRAEVNSSFFVVAYVALSLPVVGVGVVADLAGLRAAGLAIAVVVATLALAALALLLRGARGRVRRISAASTADAPSVS
jgi:hypothetical protein